MDEEQKLSQLNAQISDYAAMVLRGVLGPIPLVGSMAAELIGSIVPNQRSDRIAKFCQVLEIRLASLEQDFVRQQLTNENFTDLFEEGLRQAAHSLSDERREYIANLIANSISLDNLEYIEARHLLRILGEVNDIEVIWLRFFLYPMLKGDEAFRRKHKAILEPVVATMTSTPEERDRAALQDSYIDRLTQLGLLEVVFKTDPKTRTPQYDAFTGGQRVERHSLSALGRLLLKYVGLEVS